MFELGMHPVVLRFRRQNECIQLHDLPYKENLIRIEIGCKDVSVQIFSDAKRIKYQALYARIHKGSVPFGRLGLNILQIVIAGDYDAVGAAHVIAPAFNDVIELGL